MAHLEAGGLAPRQPSVPGEAANLELPARITTELPKFLDASGDASTEAGAGALPDWQPARPSLARRAIEALHPYIGSLGAGSARHAAVVAVTAGAVGLAALGISLERRPAEAEGPTMEEPVVERLSFIGGAAAAAIEAAMAPRSRAAAAPVDVRPAMGDAAEETMRRLTLRRSLLEEAGADPVAPPPETRPADVKAAAAAISAPEAAKPAEPARTTEIAKPAEPAPKAAEVSGPVLVRDLPAGSTLSVGTKLSDTVWLVEAQELGDVVVTLPSDAPDQFRATIAPLGSEAARSTISLQVRRTARLEPTAGAGASVPDALPTEIPQVPPAVSVAPTPPPPAVNAKSPPRARDDGKGASRTSTAPKTGGGPKVTYGGPASAAYAAGAQPSANATAPKRPKVIAPAAVRQPPAYESTAGVTMVGKPKKQQQPQVVQQKNATPPSPPLAAPSALGAPPPPPSDSGPGWLFKFLTE